MYVRILMKILFSPRGRWLSLCLTGETARSPLPNTKTFHQLQLLLSPQQTSVARRLRSRQGDSD